MQRNNLFAAASQPASEEVFQTLLENKSFKLERIVSTGQATPQGHWVDQSADEWVVLLSGAATIHFEDDGPMTLRPGDYVLIPAHTRHRVDWTEPTRPTVWLALHVNGRPE